MSKIKRINMKIKIITCWFATSYGAYTHHLRTALEKQLTDEVGIIASNCGCGDPLETARIFQNTRCDYFDFPNLRYWKSKNWVKHSIRTSLRHILMFLRAFKYTKKGKDAELVHFQQILNAFGFYVVYYWLNQPSHAKKIVTVHELDEFQKNNPSKSKVYNKADHVIVLFEGMKNELIKLNVDPNKITVVPYGIQIQPFNEEKREGIIFYGGHFIEKGKGADTLFQALAILKEKLGASTPKLKIHGHWGTVTPQAGLDLAKTYGLENDIIWLNQLSSEETINAYKTSLICALPYQGSSAGLAAVHAMAYGVPVIATQKAGLPDHLGDVGTYINENAPEELANKLLELMDNKPLWNNLSERGKIRAEQHFSWDKIAEQTLAIYKKVMQ